MNPLRLLCNVCLAGALLAGAQTASYHYSRIGGASEKAGSPRAGFALMGGGKDLDEAFQWLCRRTGGGDFLVLRATGGGRLQQICARPVPVNLRRHTDHPQPGSRGESGGRPHPRKGRRDFSLWRRPGQLHQLLEGHAGTVRAQRRDSPRHSHRWHQRGLAVLGEWAYSAQGDTPGEPNLDSAMALADPFSPRIALVHGFLEIPQLKGIITDTHFAKRDRMGRLVVFLARLDAIDTKRETPPGTTVRGIGIDEGAAVLVAADGQAEVVGHGPAWFISISPDSAVFPPGRPLTAGPFEIQRIDPGHQFDLPRWRGDARPYWLSVENGRIRSTLKSGKEY